MHMGPNPNSPVENVKGNPLWTREFMWRVKNVARFFILPGPLIDAVLLGTRLPPKISNRQRAVSRFENLPTSEKVSLPESVFPFEL